MSVKHWSQMINKSKTKKHPIGPSDELAKEMSSEKTSDKKRSLLKKKAKK